MRRLDFVFFDAGGGHRSAATALRDVIEQQQRWPWEVRLVNLQEVLEPLDIFRKLTGVRMEDVYNKLLKSGWTLGSEYLVPLMHGLIRVYHRSQVKLLTRYWKAERPDLVVSVIPNFNRALFEALRNVDPSIPLVTILTDFADYPPHFWMESQDQFLICGTGRAAAQARGMGYRPERIFETSGMILRPAFYRPVEVNREQARASLGLNPGTPTGLVLFGGQGSAVMVDLLRRLQNCRRDLQLILICGRNTQLAGRLKAEPSRFPVAVVEFTAEVPHFMHLSDFLIGKPGPGSISEALAMHLPVIVERNAWTLPQERYNAEWVREKEVGIVLDNFRAIAQAVDEVLEPDRLAKLKESASTIHNRAVFEIPEILNQILNSAGGSR